MCYYRKTFSNSFEKLTSLDYLTLEQIQYIDKCTLLKISNPTNWQDSRCFICDFPLEIRFKGYEVQEKETPYMNFTFEKNIFFQNKTR